MGAPPPARYTVTEAFTKRSISYGGGLGSSAFAAPHSAIHAPTGTPLTTPILPTSARQLPQETHET
jgi:hypothetical protein